MGHFAKAASAAELAMPPGCKAVQLEGESIAVFQVNGAYYAIGNLCPHRGAELAQGTVDGWEVVCPWHAARFDLRTGAALSPPAPHGVKCYAVRVSGDDIEVEVG